MKEKSLIRTIHLCWFSGDKYPKETSKCILTWKKILPDWNIKVWTEQMALELGIPFVSEAVSVKKWAFASDVVRAYALYSEGGLYMDSDIRLLCDFDELLLNRVCFFNEYHPEIFDKEGLDDNGRRIGENVIAGMGIQAAFIYAEPGNEIFRDIIDYYSNRHFVKDDGTYDMNVVSPAIYAVMAERYGYRYVDEYQELDEGIVVYPSRFVVSSPFDEIHQDAVAVHLSEHGWYDYTFLQKISMKLRRILNK